MRKKHEKFKFLKVLKADKLARNSSDRRIWLTVSTSGQAHLHILWLQICECSVVAMTTQARRASLDKRNKRNRVLS